MEMSHRATVVAWGPLGRTFWPRSQGSLSDPASQEGAWEAQPGSAYTSAAGPGLQRPPPPPQDTVAGRWCHRPGVAGFLASPCCCSSWGRWPPLTPSPRMDSFYFYSSEPPEGPGCSLYPCFTAPLGHGYYSPGPSFVQPACQDDTKAIRETELLSKTLLCRSS